MKINESKITYFIMFNMFNMFNMFQILEIVSLRFPHLLNFFFHSIPKNIALIQFVSSLAIIRNPYIINDSRCRCKSQCSQLRNTMCESD